MDEISPRLGGVPDFYCELFVEVSSWIPGVSRFLPTDTVKIWKKGQDIRFDITLVGFEGGTWKRGNLSFLFLGSEKKFYSLDHEENVCTNLLATSTRVERKDLDQVVEFLLSTTMMTTTLNTDNVRFERKTHWLSKTTINQDIGRWKDTHVFEMSGVEANFRIRKPTKKAKKSALSDAVILLLHQYLTFLINLSLLFKTN
jgi:predicted transposase YbfD/YdcC